MQVKMQHWTICTWSHICSKVKSRGWQTVQNNGKNIIWPWFTVCLRTFVLKIIFYHLNKWFNVIRYFLQLKCSYPEFQIASFPERCLLWPLLTNLVPAFHSLNCLHIYYHLVILFFYSLPVFGLSVNHCNVRTMKAGNWHSLFIAATQALG